MFWQCQCIYVTVSFIKCFVFHSVSEIFDQVDVSDDVQDQEEVVEMQLDKPATLVVLLKAFPHLLNDVTPVPRML